MSEYSAATLSQAFAPHQHLAFTLLPHAFDTPDPAHDICHIQRVWMNASALAAIEGGDLRILTAAVILHDCVNVPKASPDRPMASQLSARRASDILARHGWTSRDIASVAHAIAAHSYSARISPETMEAKILQDADRLDAIGAIGVARCMMLSGTIGRPLYDPADPLGRRRDLDDNAFALDHFPQQLLRLGDRMNTPTARTEADRRSARLRAFYEGLVEELMVPLGA